MGWIQFCPSTLRIINCSKKMFRNRLSATAVHRGPERTQCTTLGGSVSSLLMNSKGEEIIYPVEDDQDRIWARRLDWVVDQHLDRAEDEQNQLQRDFEAVLRQSKQARERKYDHATISYLSKQLDTARETIRALRW
jgi:hypothetical protein